MPSGSGGCVSELHRKKYAVRYITAKEKIQALIKT